MFAGMCVGMSVDVRVDMCVHICGHVRRHVCCGHVRVESVRTFVWTCVQTYVCTC